MESGEKRKRSPSISPSSKENHLISLAVDLAEKQLRDGTASPSVIAHYLRLGSPQAKLEREKMERENALLEAKTEAIKSQKANAELYERAIKAMKIYNGQDDDE